MIATTVRYSPQTMTQRPIPFEVWTELYCDGDMAIYECRDNGAVRRITLPLQDLGLLMSLALKSSP